MVASEAAVAREMRRGGGGGGGGAGCRRPRHPLSLLFFCRYDLKRKKKVRKIHTHTHDH
jgi:hypothetical protein